MNINNWSVDSDNCQYDEQNSQEEEVDGGKKKRKDCRRPLQKDNKKSKEGIHSESIESAALQTLGPRGTSKSYVRFCTGCDPIPPELCRLFMSVLHPLLYVCLSHRSTNQAQTTVTSTHDLHSLALSLDPSTGSKSLVETQQRRQFSITSVHAVHDWPAQEDHFDS